MDGTTPHTPTPPKAPAPYPPISHCLLKTSILNPAPPTITPDNPSPPEAFSRVIPRFTHCSHLERVAAPVSIHQIAQNHAARAWKRQPSSLAIEALSGMSR